MDTETRQGQITAAAIRMIAAEGVHSLSIAGIAQRVGIVPSAFYRHYKSKDDVLNAILDQLQHRLLENVAAVRKETDQATERLRRLMARHVRLLAENHAIPQIVFSDRFYVGHPERKNKVKGIVGAYLKEVQKIIAEGQKDGVILPGISPEAASVMFLGVVLPTAVIRNVGGGQLDASSYIEKAWLIFKKGIAGRVRQKGTPGGR